MTMVPEYIPYVKYVISPGSRFERDAKIFFDADGPVSRGETLQNYGWNQTGFKQLIEAFYFSSKETNRGFEKYFETKIRYTTENIVELLRRDGILKGDVRGLIRLKIAQKMAIPVLLVEIPVIRYKYCLKPANCKRLWRHGRIPAKLKNLLGAHNLTVKYANRFRCSRHFCYELCGEYKQCELMYTSLEGDKKAEEKILNCIIQLIRQIELKKVGSKKFKCRPWTPEDRKKKRIGSLKPWSKCFERPVRLDLKPLRYYILDPDTWKEIEKERYNRNTRNQFDAFPADYLPDIFNDKFDNSTELSVPLRAPGVLECFLQLAAVKFELKHDVMKECNICGRIHKLIKIPIKAMFRKINDEVYCQETGFAELLWNELWTKYPDLMCKSFQKKAQMTIRESKIIKRELKVSNLAESKYPEASYDFAINLKELIPDRNEIFVFDLTTALWKKSGFHETSRPPDEHLERWKEMLCEIPNSKTNVFAIWYIVVNQTQNDFFDSTAPKHAESMQELLNLVTEKHPDCALIIRRASDIDRINLKKHKLLVVPVFNSTPRKGEARYELRRLYKRDFSKLLIKQVIDFLL
jgi:hypothetical protein